ncbi:ABC transporter ATP-binding protein [Paenibacillus filicis]|uniref:ABC transporter ATP-binding protein n=1 Tax=Paenibacillus gyeongsangnamensis TaxID=3388067 RepID=A0ABT4Q9X3_9BACL|nr:ABC transporter ATP-binding protein [Paenibacillus filicis]MCZ8513631.1 ABC transporter ATP-binding protein [Paenibacillus filicis]
MSREARGEGPAAAAAAEVCRLRLKFPGSGGLLFDDLSIAVPKGQKVLLLGPSGCGKSTLLQVMAGLIPGSIEVPMKAEKLLVPDSWGYLFQDPDAQFCMPFVDEELAFVLENMSVPREAMEGLIRDALHKAQLHLPEAHVPIASLSQGMKQRLAIASLLLMNPEVWFLDEPTALLDPEGTDQVWSTIRQVAADRTVLIVEHKIEEIVSFVDRVVLFDGQARIIADGKPEDVFREHEQAFREYGIWYPGVWEDYAESLRYGNLLSGRTLQSENAEPQTLAEIREFAGFHGKARKIFVHQSRIAPGDWIAVVGENGAGKSTLLQSLMQLIRTEGRYSLAGRMVYGFADIADAAAYVFQNPEMQFVTNSVFDEVAFTLRRSGEKEESVTIQTSESLEWFGLSEHRGHHPYQLSLGQKRRLSVAAAAVEARRMLLLDEPTFGQDAANTFALLEKLEAWRAEGTAVVMVTHDPQIVRYFATRVWEVKQGELAAELSPEAYLRRFEEKAKAEAREEEIACS